MSRAPPRTIDFKPGPTSMIKPGELIDIVEITPLTLSDRRIYNQLIRNAWDRIDESVEHVIAKKALRGSHNVNDRVGESIERLMGAFARIRVLRDGEEACLRVQLLGANTEHCRRDGMFYYRFPRALRNVIKESRVFARLDTEIMLAMSSKYGLALYEMIQKRGNLEHIWFEDFALDRLRAMLGVSDGKLTRYPDLNRWALQPAAVEVNALSNYRVQTIPYRQGRRVTSVRITWCAKNVDGLKAAYSELRRRKPGPLFPVTA